MKQQMAEIVKALMEMKESNMVILKTMEEMSPMVKALSGWKPKMEVAVSDLRTKVKDMQAQVLHVGVGAKGVSMVMVDLRCFLCLLI